MLRDAYNKEQMFLKNPITETLRKSQTKRLYPRDSLAKTSVAAVINSNEATFERYYFRQWIHLRLSPSVFGAPTSVSQHNKEMNHAEMEVKRTVTEENVHYV